MSRQTYTTFSYGASNGKSNGIIIDLTLPYDLAGRIETLTYMYKSDTPNTIRTLLYTALKNNFTSAYEYIPCKQQSGLIPYALPNKRKNVPKTIQISFKASKTLHSKLIAISNKYYTSVSQATRILLSIAIQFNYNDNLKFKKAEPLPNGQYFENVINNNINMPTIFLDII